MKTREVIITVKKWTKEDKKIYLHTQDGHKYRYVGRYELEKIQSKYPKGTSLYIGLTLRKNKWIFFDNAII